MAKHYIFGENLQLCIYKKLKVKQKASSAGQ